MTIPGRLSFAEAEAFLNGFTNFEKIGVPVLRRGDRGRMAALLAALGDPQTGCPAVHVTGSKGKGTTCLLLEALLQGAGATTRVTTGVYLSPHVECVTERIRVRGAQLTRDAFAAALAEIQDAVAALEDRPTYFEILTALAWRVFRSEAVDVAIVEAGIGGLYDATSLLDPVLTAVTSVELEHTNVLGRTEGEILRQKLGIARSGVPMVLGPLRKRLRKAAVEELERIGAPCLLWNEAVRLRFRDGTARVTLAAPLPDWRVRFRAPDRPFAVNAALALAGAAAYLKEPPENAVPILESCRIPGRQELLPGRPPILLDVAHTLQSLKALRATISRRFPGRAVTVVFALAANKDARRLLPIVESFASHLILVQADPVRGRPAPELAELSHHPDRRAMATVEEALDRAVEAAGPDSVVCVCGSFVLVGLARVRLREAPLIHG